MPHTLPNLIYLRQFIAVAKQGSISEAARALNISQPALSKSIRKLEQTVGAPLLERGANGIKLTRAGEVFVDRAQVIALEYEHALQHIRNVIDEQESTINIMSGPIWSTIVVPSVLDRFHRLFPNIRLKVTMTGAADVADHLRLGRTEIYAGAIIHRDIPEDFKVQIIARSSLVVLAPRSHPLAQKRSVAPHDLCRYPFVLYSPTSEIFRHLAAFLNHHQAPMPKVVLETSSLQSCLEVLRLNDFLMFETAMIAQGNIGDGLVAIDIGETLCPFDIGLVYRPGLERIPHYGRLLQIMAEAMLGFSGSTASPNGLE